MKLGAMQPYFFPYLGYFDLIYNTDKWVVFEVSKYIRHGWINRNRILHPCEGFQYMTVPLQKHSSAAPINQLTISDNQDWKTSVRRQLYHYHTHAPFYKETMSLVEDCLAYNETLLYKLNIYALEKVCARLEIPFKYTVFSEMNLELGPIHKSGDWALQLCKAMGATTYINPPGGRSIYDPQEFLNNGIHLIIREFENMKYSAGPYQSVPGLSIIDVLMWNSPESIHGFLKQNRIGNK